MGQCQYIGRAQRRAQQVRIAGQAAAHQVVAQQAELVHREAMLGGEVRAVIVVVDQWQGHEQFKEGGA